MLRLYTKFGPMPWIGVTHASLGLKFWRRTQFEGLTVGLSKVYMGEQVLHIIFQLSSDVYLLKLI